MNQKGFASIILLLAILVVLGAAGYFTSAKYLKKKNIAPSITSLSPTSGTVGIKVIITGSRFTPTNNSVKFGGGYLNQLSSTGTAIIFTIPEGLTPCPPNATVCPQSYMQVTPSSYSVSVINSNGASNAANFTVTPGSAPISPTPTPSGGTGSVKSGTGTVTVQPEDPNKAGIASYPDLSLTSLSQQPLSIKSVVEHRSALNGKTVSIRGVIISTLLGEKACPPDRGMCAQPSIFLADTTDKNRNTLYDLRVLVGEEEQEKSYPIGKAVDLQVVVAGSKVAVVARKTY